MRRAALVLVLLLGPPLTAAACLWDRDTPAEEAKGMPEVVAALTGRFDRNPPLFYEMRLNRTKARLLDDPDDLDAYDDAGVACDRIGRGDEAIGWMEKKRSRLETLDRTLPRTKDHAYRYHANLGTFLVHRWARRGADRARLDEVKAARDEIAKALEINPNAHFGREKYQLRAIDWILKPPSAAGQSLPNLLDWNPDDIFGQDTDPKEAEDAVRGLAGLVVLGNAWESVDVFNALSVALRRDSVGFERRREGGRNTLAYFAYLRCRELIDAGQGSMLPDAPKGEDLKNRLYRLDFTKPDVLLEPAYRELRAEADARHAKRAAFMTARLKNGLHPDTDSGFWSGYVDPPAPELPTQSDPDAFRAWMARRQTIGVAVLIAVSTLAIGSVVLVSIMLRRSLSEAPRPSEEDFMAGSG